MAKRTNQRPRDVNALGKYLVNWSEDEDNQITPLPSKEQISNLMATLGSKGGRIGGKRRLETMTPEERSAVARKAAHARWKRKKI